MLSEAVSAAHYEKMYNRVSALADIGVWECELATNTLTWTEKVYDLFDLPRGSPLDRTSLVECYVPESRSEMERLRAEAIRTGRGFSLDIEIQTFKGARRWIRLTVQVEREDGRSVRIFGTKQDITKEREAQERVQILQAELTHLSRLSAMSAMASTLAHELNQPLTAVSNYMAAARRLSAQHELDPRITKCIVSAEETALRAGEIIRRIRQIGKHRSEKSESNIVSVIEEAVAVIALGKPEIDVACDLDYRGSIKADSLSIQQVLLSLLDNACEAAKSEFCRIEVRTSLFDGFAEVCVSDEGSGFDRRTLPKIFDLLEGGGPEGVGVGLSISRTIIEAQGGRIWAEHGPNGRAEIRFTLPTAS